MTHMVKTNVTKTTSTQTVNDADVVSEQVVTAEHVDNQEFALAKLAQFVWLIGHLIATLLSFRILFLLFGANRRGIVLFIYNLSEIFVRPFKGIFASPSTGVSYFDTAAILAILMYYVLIAIILSVLQLMSKNTDTDV